MEIIPFLSDEIFVLNQKLFILCGEQVSWKRNNVLIANSSRLTIESASLLDSGTYTCDAVNTVGRDSIEYNVEVFCELLNSSKMFLPLHFTYLHSCFMFLVCHLCIK